MKMGVYVGSFNPPHLGHLHVINYLLENKYVDKVIVIPTGSYWDKTNLIDVCDRINMLKFYEKENIIINDTLNDLPFTYQVLNYLSEMYPNESLFLIIGDDNLEKFHLWKNYQEIIKYNVIVLNRNNINYHNTIAYRRNPNAFTIINHFPKLDISSTQIRNALENKNYELISNYLDLNVLKYIIENNLYRNNSFKEKTYKLKK